MTGYDDITERGAEFAKRLRDNPYSYPCTNDEMADAFDGLRAALQEARSENERHLAQRNSFARELRPGIAALRAEVERLRAALTDAIGAWDNEHGFDAPGVRLSSFMKITRARVALAGSPSPQPPTEETP